MKVGFNRYESGLQSVTDFIEVFSNCPYMEESPMKVNSVSLLSKFSVFT